MSPARTQDGTAKAATTRAATRATYVAFAGSGFAFANWAARIPQVRDHLGLDAVDARSGAARDRRGSVLALPLSGPVVTRIGSGRAVVAMAVLLGVGLAAAALGYLAGVVPVVIGLFLFGFANGTWDVAMNVQGTVVERHLSRSIMSRFHAGFSLGTVAGALVGAAHGRAARARAAHLCAVAVRSQPLWRGGPSAFVPDHEPTRTPTAGDRAGRAAR